VTLVLATRDDAALPASDAPALAWSRTPRLALREFHADDHASLVAMHRDVRLRAHLVDDYPLHDDAVARLLLQRLAGHLARRRAATPGSLRRLVQPDADVDASR
jgi:hypothetical protein